MTTILGAACGGNDLPASLGEGPGGAGGSPDASATCSPGKEGCPCSNPGQTAACGHIVTKYGDYVTCTTGQSACQNGTWGPCLGDHLVAKSVASYTAAAGGTGVLAAAGPCPDPCDPNSCTQTTEGPGDVDASGIAFTDAGVTSQPVFAGGGDGGGSGDGAVCTGTQCQVDWQCPGSSPTTLTGTVYDPAGINPLYNAYVYIPVDPSGNLPPFTTGATCDTCSGVTLNAVAVAQTDIYGHFTLTNVPTTDFAPNTPIPLVVQMGKWRRLEMLPSVPKCQTTAVAPANSRLPKNKFDGFNSKADIPKMGIATGYADPFECMMLKAGIDPAEFQLPGGGGNRRIDFYRSTSSPTGYQGLDFYPGKSGGSVAPPLSSLVNSLTTLLKYDVVLLPCEAEEDDTNDAYAGNVASYTNAGGRLFTTHYGYTWLSTPSNGVAKPTNPSTGKPNPFYGVANWNLSYWGANSEPAVVDQGFAKGKSFAQWLQNVGATSTLGNMNIVQPRWDLNSTKPPATEWVHDAVTPYESFHFTFNTPLGAGDAGPDGGGGVCGRVVFSDFHVSTSDIVSGNCATNTDCGYSSTCSGGTVGTCTVSQCRSNGDCGSWGGTCNGVKLGTCKQYQACSYNSDCSSGMCDGFGNCVGTPGTCLVNTDCPYAEDCNGGTPGTCSVQSCTSNAQCTQGQLCKGGQCIGCGDGSYCPDTWQCNGGAIGTCSPLGNTFPVFPQGCSQAPMTAQEDALEFMLFDLTACISPDNAPPPPPPAPVIIYKPVTFTELLTSSCPSGTHTVWRQLQWQASIPSTASISFSAQTADPPPNWSTAQSVALATATTSTVLPGWDSALIDASPSGHFNTAVPPVASKGDLLLTITLNPTTNQAAAPTLGQWQVVQDCPPTE